MSTTQNGLLATLIAVSGTWLLLPVRGNAHDLPGLMAIDSLPKPIQRELKENEQLRNADLPPLADPTLSQEERKKLVAENKLPKRFERYESVVNALALWPQKRHLSLCAFDGSREARDSVLKVAHDVFDETNLTLSDSIPQCTKYDSADIRITFRAKGYWSYVGTEALKIPNELPTLGLHNIDQRLPLDESAKGVIRHEFMHAAGALHEHQHPGANCESELNWNYVAQQMDMKPKEMEVNFKQLAFSKNVKATAYDQKSIMHYQLSPAYWKKGASSSCYLPFQNTTLSAGDVAMLRDTYPKN